MLITVVCLLMEKGIFKFKADNKDFNFPTQFCRGNICDICDNICIENRIIEHVNVNAKVVKHAEKILVGILAHLFVRTALFVKRITETSVIECDEIIFVMDIVSTKTNTIAKNVTSTLSLSLSKKRHNIKWKIAN